MTLLNKRFSKREAALAVLAALLIFTVAATAGIEAQQQAFDINRTLKALPEFELEKEANARDATVYYLKGENSRRMRIEVITGIDSDSAMILTDGEITGIRAIYANALSAYPGEVSHEVECNKKFLPGFYDKRTKLASHRYILVYSTERFGLGACNEDLVRYKHLLGWTYCPAQEQLLHVKYFAPLEDEFEALERVYFLVSCE